ncbi:MULTISPECIES: TOBE domain-containing protein [unclassified Desulfovibrio]|uniref:TOBE domain-containing protein n=1 Tax=unclassified Desulfovibrio TaxID=2593640 RepID=UPI0013EB8783|nr:MULTISPECIES: TOBE domain-containing protein [unclassified Desulfovibrio]
MDTREAPSGVEAPAPAPNPPRAQPGAVPSAGLTEAQLAAAELWLEERLYARAQPRLRHPRVRLWFIFMLLRHAGLRLVEIFRLRGGSLDFGRGLLRVPGSGTGTAREVPLPPAVARKLGSLWASWEGRELPLPFLCDASRVRRGLAQCARACGLAPELFTARELRRHRGLELVAAGLQPALVDMFLGREAAEKKSLVRFDADAAQALLRERIQGRARSSARNHFRGRITRVRPMGLLADVAFATASGLEVRARITSRSLRAMGLAPGVIVSGAVKALWIEVRPADNAGGADEELNRLPGTVDSLRREDGFAEILISLDGGLLACAVRPAGEVDWLGEPGQKVAIVFSPAAVILAAG